MLLALPCSLFACGPDLITTDDDDDALVMPNQPLPPIDLDEWCDDPGLLPPFADQGPVSRLEEQGPCGHLLTTWHAVGEPREWTLWHPDGSSEALGDAPRVASEMFSPTGRLLAWAEGGAGAYERVTLRDVQTGESRTIEAAPVTYGFVRIPDSDPGAALWLCHDDVLELVGVELEDSRVLAEDVDCWTVSGGELSTRLVYVDLDKVLSVVDALTGIRWSTELGDAGEATSLSPDGRLARDHHQVGLSRAVDLDRGELLASCDHLRFEQALLLDAPTFVLCDGQLSVWRGEVLEPILDEVLQASVVTTTDGSAFFRRNAGDHEEIWFSPVENPSEAQLVVSLPDEQLHSFEVSDDGQHGRLTVNTSACADVNCTQTITEIRTWTREGLGGSFLAAGEWRQLHVFADGQALGFGAPIEGPLPEGAPIPSSQLIVDGVDGALENSWSFDGEASFAQPLDDARLLVRGDYGLQDYELVFDRAAPTLELLLGPAEVTGQRLDPRLGLLALTVESDGADRLYWGAVSQ